MVLVSNNQYRLGRAIGSGTRPRIDDGLLGITAVAEPTGRGERGRSPQRPLRAWSAPTFEVDSDRPIAAGIDGEALMLDAPLRFASDPASCACASRASTRALTLGHGPRRAMGRRGRAGANRRRPPPETRNATTKEAGMDLIEITEKERLSREDAAARLHALADMLARHNEVEFDRGGLRFKVHVPDEVDFKLEIEIDDDETELEIELKW